MTDAALPALGGYALGTAQILALDWLRARWAHARQLRLLRADLRRVAEFRAKFNLQMDRPPVSDELPRAPTMSARFVDTVSNVDFWITDEHGDDNTQQGLLGIADGFVALADIHARALKHIDALRADLDLHARREEMEMVVSFAADYDRQLDRFLFTVADSLRDLDRRLEAARLRPQLWRLIRRMPKGSNPEPLKPDDPRLERPDT